MGNMDNMVRETKKGGIQAHVNAHRNHHDHGRWKAVRLAHGPQIVQYQLRGMLKQPWIGQGRTLVGVFEFKAHCRLGDRPDYLSTKEIMVKFYEYLAEGMGKADALAEAKRWYRKENPNAPPSE